MRHLLSILWIVFLTGCITGNVAGDNISEIKAVETGDRVSVEYIGMLDDGTVFDTSEGRSLLEFTAGAGQMIVGFDSAVIGMIEGEEKIVRIRFQEAYGEHRSDLLKEIPKSELPSGVKLGDTFTVQGRLVKVVEVGANTVTFDFNHPLAGKDLTFRIKMAKIEKK